MNHLNDGPERDLEPPKHCLECGGDAGYLVMDMCPDCYNTAKAEHDYEMSKHYDG